MVAELLNLPFIAEPGCYQPMCFSAVHSAAEPSLCDDICAIIWKLEVWIRTLEALFNHHCLEISKTV